MEGKCEVCGKSLEKHEELTEHLISNSTRMMDGNHSFYERRVRDSNFKDPCFCGGEIKTYRVRQAVCEKCGYIWAED